MSCICKLFIGCQESSLYLNYILLFGICSLYYYTTFSPSARNGCGCHRRGLHNLASFMCADDLLSLEDGDANGGRGWLEGEYYALWGAGSMGSGRGLWCTVLGKCWLGFCAWPDFLGTEVGVWNMASKPCPLGHCHFHSRCFCFCCWLSMLLASKYMDTNTHTHTHTHTCTCISIDIHIMLVIFALSLWGDDPFWPPKAGYLPTMKWWLSGFCFSAPSVLGAFGFGASVEFKMFILLSLG